MRWVFYLLLVLNAGYFLGQILLPDYFQAPGTVHQKQVDAGKSILLASEIPDLVHNSDLSGMPIE